MKKKIFTTLSLTVALALAVSCKKESFNEQDNSHSGSKITVTASIAGASSKVSYEEDAVTHNLKPTWELSDIVIGFDSKGKTYGYAVKSIDEKGVASMEIITSGDYVGSVTEDPENGTAMYMFYAPGMKPTDIGTDPETGHPSLVVSIKEQSKDVIPALMMAQGIVDNDKLVLSFTNETSIIGIKNPTMAGANKTYTNISIFGSAVNTEFKFSTDGQGCLVMTPQSPGRINKSVDFTTDAEGKTTGVTYIVTNPITSVVKLTFLADNGEHHIKNGVSLAKGNYYYTSPSFKSLPENALPGGFSVKDKGGVISVVFFSKGNLYSTDDNSNNNWEFEANQYDFRTYKSKTAYINGSKTTTPSNNWGLLGWSTTASSNYGGRHTKTSASSAYTDGQFKDWGELIDNTRTWITLTREQWKWLIGPKDVFVHNKECRESSTINGVPNARFISCKVNGVQGLILFPDVFSWPTASGAPSKPNASLINSHTGKFASLTYTKAQFKLLEDAGAVFLPATGMRQGQDLKSTDDRGLYWSATQNDTATVNKNPVANKVFALFYMDGNGVGEGSMDNWQGLFVRLVTEAK